MFLFCDMTVPQVKTIVRYIILTFEIPLEVSGRRKNYVLY